MYRDITDVILRHRSGTKPGDVVSEGVARDGFDDVHTGFVWHARTPF